MARDWNAVASAARQQKEQERTERYRKLLQDVIGSTEEIMDSTFPLKDDDTPDWDKFDWTKAEAFKQLLAAFQQGNIQTNRPPREERPENDQAQQRQRRRDRDDRQPAAEPAVVQPDPATATTAAAPTPDPADQPSRTRRILDRLNK
jgi:hypothetical protein